MNTGAGRTREHAVLAVEVALPPAAVHLDDVVDDVCGGERVWLTTCACSCRKAIKDHTTHGKGQLIARRGLVCMQCANLDCVTQATVNCVIQGSCQDVRTYPWWMVVVGCAVRCQGAARSEPSTRTTKSSKHRHITVTRSQSNAIL